MYLYFFILYFFLHTMMLKSMTKLLVHLHTHIFQIMHVMHLNVEITQFQHRWILLNKRRNKSTRCTIENAQKLKDFLHNTRCYVFFFFLILILWPVGLRGDVLDSCSVFLTIGFGCVWKWLQIYAIKHFANFQ